MNNRDIGKMGESHFENLCNQVDITANSSNPDRYGWDYLLEFPKNDNSTLPLDMQDIPIEGKVQVKASDTNNGKCQIKLSAMERLVKSSSPAFIYFVNFNASHEPLESFLVHIDESIIEQVLKRIRKNEVSQEKKELHKIKITMKYDESHRLNNVCGVALKKQIEKYIPNGMKLYIEKKAHSLANIGFTEQSMNMKITFPDKSVLVDLMDTSLGIKDTKVPVFINDMTMSRFDIKTPMASPLVDSKNVTIRVIPKPAQKATLSFKKNKLSTLLKFDMDMYKPPILLEDSLKLVFKNNFFTIIFKIQEMEYNFKFSCKYKASYKFKELFNYLKFFDILDKNPNSLILCLAPEKSSIIEMPFSAPSITDNDMLIYFSLIEKLKKVYNYLSLDIDFDLSLFDLAAMEIYINNLYGLLFLVKGEEISLPFLVEKVVDELPSNAVIILPTIVLFNGTILCVFVLYDALITKQSEYNFKMTSVAIRDVEKFHFSLEEFSENILEESKNIVNSILDEEGILAYASSDIYIENFEITK